MAGSQDEHLPDGNVDEFGNFEVPDHGLVLEASGRVLGAGDSFLSRYGYDDEDVYLQSIHDLVAPQSSSMVVEGIASLAGRPDGEVLMVGEGSMFAPLPRSVRSHVLPSGDLVYTTLFTPAMPRILIADDEPFYRGAIADSLRDRGYAVEEGANGGEAVALAEEWAPDIILMDLNMPKVDGFAASRTIRRARGGDALSIIAVSGILEDKILPTCEEHGINGVLAKPFELEELYELIGQHSDHLQLAS